MLNAPPRPPKSKSSRKRRTPVTVNRPYTPRGKNKGPSRLAQWKKSIQRRWKNWWNYHGQPKRLLKYGFLAAFWLAVLCILVGVYFYISLPDIKQLVDMDTRPTVTILDKDDREVARLGDAQGEILKVKEISPNMIEAVQAIEDRRFYKHFGIDPFGLARAVWHNITGKDGTQGGSTITQQLAKNLFLSPERTVSRKVKEATLALYLEYKYTKDEILAAYLNRVYFGAGAYGVDAASRIYFKTSARQLTLPQAALLAGLLKAPARYSPDNDPILAAKRAKIVLAAMLEAGFIDEATFKNTLIKPLPKKDYNIGGTQDMHYFSDWVVSQAEGYIGENAQNLVIRTTLDGGLQHYSAAQLQKILAKDGEKMNASQGASISLRIDGAVLAMVGGADYGDSQYNRVTQATRQSGSAFKPFVYLAALETGRYTPDSWVEDAPFSIGGYTPTNYGGKYAGGMTLRSALANSVNTVAVRLLHDVGIGRTKRVAQRLGITEPLNSDLSLALGTSGVHLISLTAAYATFGNNGFAVEPYGIREIRTGDGKMLFTHPNYAPAPLVEPIYVAMMNQMLQGVIQYGTGEHAKLDRPAAGKTGTTQNYRDALFVGYTPDIATGVWVGNDDNTPMKKVTGGSLPATIWHDVMEYAHRSVPYHNFSGATYGDAPVPVPVMNDGLPPSRDPQVVPENNGVPPSQAPAVDTNTQSVPVSNASSTESSDPGSSFDNLLKNVINGDGETQSNTIKD